VKPFLIMLTILAVPVTMGLVSSYRAGVLPYQIRRTEQLRQRNQQHSELLTKMRKGDTPIKTHYEAWEDDYNGRD